MGTVTYTPSQQEAIDKSVNAFNAGIDFTIAGYAGTGKSEIVKGIIERIPDIVPCTFTGISSHVLQQKGVASTTIHSNIYVYDFKTKKFYLNKTFKPRGFLVDEASMISDYLFHDLRSFRVPIIFVGDPGQLPPVSSKDINLMEDYDVLLTEIHRQAANNPIIDIATKIRNNEPLEEVNQTHPGGRCVIGYEDLTDQDMFDADIVICATNKTRHDINYKIRYHEMVSVRGMREALVNQTPVISGERMICTKNDTSLGVYNGMIFTVKKVIKSKPRRSSIVATMCDGTERDMVLYHTPPESKNDTSWSLAKKEKGKSVFCDYAYGITCHKSQGSQFKSVYLIDERCRLWCPYRYLYTGVTRATNSLVVDSKYTE